MKMTGGYLQSLLAWYSALTIVLLKKSRRLSTSLILSNQSRKFETEADQVSLEILQKLGRDPESMVKFFDKVAAECGEGCNKPNFFDSHPRLDHRQALFE